jgi:hypothetical protein
MTNEEKTKLCPKIVLKGWWWKKYIPYYIKKSEAVNSVFLYEWLHGGYEAYEKMINICIDKMYLEKFPPIRVSNG